MLAAGIPLQRVAVTIFLMAFLLNLVQVVKTISCSTERELLERVGVPYTEPHERCC